MQMQTLPFAEWTPDLPNVASGCTEAKNVIPHQQSYLPFKSLTTTSDALSAYARGAAAWQDKDGNVEAYAGDATKLYRLANAAWADKSGATYTTGSTNFWRFVKWGEGVIATNLADAVQYKAFGAGTNFAALGGSPPKAKCLAVVRSFVVLGDVNDGTGYPNKVVWSGQNLETSWGSNPATQADSQLLAGDGGRVQAIMGGPDGVIFQERSIWTMRYEGPPVIFSFQEVGAGMGTPAARSVVRYGPTIYFLGQDGFYRYDVGQGITPIGDKKVDRWFFDRVDKDQFYRMNAVVDVLSGTVMWCYSTGPAYCDEIILYDYKTGQWSYAQVDTEIIFPGLGEGYTLEGLDTPFSSSIDTAGMASLDAEIWKGGALGLYGFSTSSKSGTFSGDALTARLETVEMARDEGSMIYVNSARPLTQGDGAVNTVYVGTRDTLNSNYSYGSGAAANAIGEHNLRDVGRYMRFRTDISGGFERAIGVRVNVSAGGVR